MLATSSLSTNVLSAFLFLTNFFFSLAAAGGKKGPNHYE